MFGKGGEANAKLGTYFSRSWAHRRLARLVRNCRSSDTNRVGSFRYLHRSVPHKPGNGSTAARLSTAPLPGRCARGHGCGGEILLTTGTERENKMVSKTKSWAVAAMLVLALTGCQAMTGKTAGTNVDDAAITASVKSKLVADKIANLTRVDVDTNNGVVSLNGVVDSAQQKGRAEELTRRVDGVRGINNNLQISSR